MSARIDQYEIIRDSDCEDGDEFPDEELMLRDIAAALQDFDDFAGGRTSLQVSSLEIGKEVAQRAWQRTTPNDPVSTGKLVFNENPRLQRTRDQIGFEANYFAAAVAAH